VSEAGGDRADVNVRIQKARGSFPQIEKSVAMHIDMKGYKD
jgi:hypothetical protein